jgi:hypothetical protein
MAKHARIRRERAEREAAKEEEKERGPVSVRAARHRALVSKKAGIGRGVWATGTKLHREIKQNSVFNNKALKKTRVKKRGRR